MDLNKLKQEADLTRFLFDKASRQKVPLSGTFELSPVCNFSCRMCYVRKTAKEVAASPRPMLTCEQWLEIAKRMREKGMLYLLLTGGEPLLWPDFWQLYEQLVKMGFLISINTNGSLIDEEAVARFKENCPTRINITLYGASDGTYEALCRAKGVFKKVDNAITALKEAGIPVRLNCSLTPHNVHDLEKIVDYAAEKELILAATTYMFPPVRRDASMVGQNERFTPQEAVKYNLKRYRLQFGEEDYIQYLEQLKKGLAPPPGLEESCMDTRDGHIRCRAGNASFWITWDGWMSACGMMEHPKVDLTEMSAEQGFEQLSRICDELRLSKVCEECPNRQICHVCAAAAVSETGDFAGIPEYMCEMMKTAKQQAEKELSEYRNRDREDKL